MTTMGLNNLFCYFLFSQFIFLLIFFYETPVISSAIPVGEAVWLHAIGLFWAVLGYFTVRFAAPVQEEKRSDEPWWHFTTAFFVWSYVFVIAGTIISVLQVTLFVPLAEHMAQLFSGDFEAGIRDAFLLPSDEGGLPGIIKMFASSPLSIYLMSLGLLNFLKLEEADQCRLKILSRIALVGVLIKILFSFEHKNIMAVLLANMFLLLRKRDVRNVRYWILIALGLLLADYLFIKRLEDFGILDFTLVYLKMGLVNFQLLIDSISEYTYGFSTILAPLQFIFKFFNLSSPEFEYNFEWVWNPAQYFSSYAFLDFGYLYFVLFYLTGIILFVIDFKALKQKNVNSAAIYFGVLFGVVSLLFVPIIRALDFWFTLLLPLFLTNLMKGRVPIATEQQYPFRRRLAERPDVF